MEVYFEFPEIGELMVEHSFYMLDGEPVLFVCIDSKGNRFLCSCYQMSTNWVIGQVQEKALIALIDDQITIREVFKQYCSLKWNVSWDGTNFILNSDVSDDILPIEGARLELAKEKDGRYKETLMLSFLRKKLPCASYGSKTQPYSPVRPKMFSKRHSPVYKNKKKKNDILIRLGISAFKR